MLGLTGEVERGVRDVALEVTGAIVEAAPVDTGNLRAQVVPNIGGPGATPSSTRENVSTTDQAAGIAAMGAYRIGMGEVHITLHASYTEEVDKRQPFVKDAIDRGVAAAVAKGAVTR